MARYYIIAGEASGDLHGSNLIKALGKKDPNATFRCWGGDKMKAQGADLIKHYRDLAFMGFVEVVLNLRTILRNIAFCKKDLLAYRPDALILIDYPGFNMRIATFAKKHHIPVHYYIAPQVWAWKENRVQKLKKIIDKLYVILPFEETFFEGKHGLKVDFVGHPLLDAIADLPPPKTDFFTRHQSENKPIIALLPGSRKQEIKKMLGVMLAVVPYYKNYLFIIAGLHVHSQNFYGQFTKNTAVKIIYDDTFSLLKKAKAALVASGTASLETALFHVPQVVCYKGSWLSYHIGKWLIKVKFISLVNLIMNRAVVKELIQNDFTAKKLSGQLSKLLNDKNHINRLKNDYKELSKKLGGGGASEKVATEILQPLQKSIL